MNLVKCGILLILAGILLFVCCIIVLTHTIVKTAKWKCRCMKKSGEVLDVELYDGTKAVFFSSGEGLYIEENGCKCVKGILIIKKSCR